MPETLRELTDWAVGVFHDRRSPDAVYGRPAVPVCVCCMGEGTHAGIAQTLQAVWGPNAGQAAFLRLKPGADGRPETSGPDGAPVAFGACLDRMLRAENNVDARVVYLNFVLNTRGLDADALSLHFALPRKLLAPYEGHVSFRTLLFLLLDESFSHIGQASCATGFVRRLESGDGSPEEKGLYDVVYVLSNKLYNNALLPGDNVHDRLMGDIIVLGCNRDDERRGRSDLLFAGGNAGGRHVALKTAAFATAEKPAREIVSVCLHELIPTVTEILSRSSPLGPADVTRRLGVNDHGLPLITSFFKKQVLPLLPGEEQLAFLPRTEELQQFLERYRPAVYKDDTLLGQFSRGTAKAWDLFRDRYFTGAVQKTIGDPAVMRAFEEDFRRLAERAFCFTELLSALPEPNAGGLLQNCRAVPNLRRCETFFAAVRNAAVHQCLACLYDRLLPVCDQALRDICGDAARTEQELQGLAAQANPSVLPDDGLTRHISAFYRRLVRDDTMTDSDHVKKAFAHVSMTRA